MAISNLEQAMAGMQPQRIINKGPTTTAVVGRWFSSFTLPGQPDAGAFDTTTAGGVALVQGNTQFAFAVAGCIPHYDPASGNSYLANISVLSPSAAGSFILADRLWHCGANTTGPIVTTATGFQNIDSVAWPARDQNQSANGVGVMIGLEIVTTLSAVVPSFTITYKNSDGSADLTGANTTVVGSASGAQSFYPFSLNVGDRGVQNVTTFHSTVSSAAGSFGLVAYRPLIQVDVPSGDGPNPIDMLSGGFPQIYNGACPFLLFLAEATGSWSPFGYYQETQG
jgi:hypothetical protein